MLSVYRVAMAAVFAFLTAVTTLAWAQDARPREDVRPRTDATAKADAGSTVRARSILGSKVSISGGRSAGTVEDIVMSNDGVVEYLVVSDGGRLRTVPWEATRFDYGRRAATIDIAPERFEKIPTYTTERYPNFYAPTYREQVYKYYNLKPGQQRRLERQEKRIERKEERREERRP